MKITDSYTLQKNIFEDKGIKIPLFDDSYIRENTEKVARWIHFGGGNLYRCLHAKIAQELLNQKDMESGIVVIESFGQALVEEVYKKNDYRSLSVVMKADGTFEKELIASTAKACFINRKNIEELNYLTKLFTNERLQMITFTITEKGYAIKDSKGEVLPQIKSDMESGPNFEQLQTTIAQVAFFLYQRFKTTGASLALVSTDNFSHNGERLKEALRTIIQGWVSKAYVDQTFYNYVFESGKISFPYSMVDRITPTPSEKISALLGQEGIEEMELIQQFSGPPLAAFVNTEEVYYLAIEDHFPNGRPPLEKIKNVFIEDKETVNKMDLMKVTTCLNPLHTALAITGSLMGYKSIYETVQNKDLLQLIEKIGYQEGLKVVENPQVIDPKEFIDEVIYKRLMNPNIPDTPQRIATDTSQKMAIRFGETLKAYNKAELETNALRFIPFVIAAWFRYLMQIDDFGNRFEASSDPLLDELNTHLKDIRLGETTNVQRLLGPMLSNQEIFGVNLYEIGIGKQVEELFAALITEPFAVKKMLRRLLEEDDKNGDDL